MSLPIASWMLAYTCCRREEQAGSATTETIIHDTNNGEEDGHPLMVQTKKLSLNVTAENENRLFFLNSQKLMLPLPSFKSVNHRPVVEDENGNYARRLACVGDDGICKLVQEAPLGVKQDASFILAAVKREPLALQFADDVVRADKDIVLAAVRHRGDAFFFASDDLKQERDFVMRVVGTKSGTLKYASEELQADPQIQEEAETTSYTERVLNADNSAVVSMLVRDAPERWRTDFRYALLTVKKCGRALQHVPESLRDDKEVVFAAVRQDGNALAFASRRLRSDKAIVLAAVRTSPAAIKFAVGPLSQDHDCLKAAGLWQEYSWKGRKWQAILSVKDTPDDKSKEYSLKYHRAFKNDPTLGRFKSSFTLAWYPVARLRVPDFTKFAKVCTGTRPVDSNQETQREAPVGIFVQAQENSGLSDQQSLEAESAINAGLKIFRTCTNLEGFYQAGFERLGHAVNAWIESGYKNMDLETVFIGSQEWWAPPCKTRGISFGGSISLEPACFPLNKNTVPLE